MDQAYLNDSNVAYRCSVCFSSNRTSFSPKFYKEALVDLDNSDFEASGAAGCKFCRLFHQISLSFWERLGAIKCFRYCTLGFGEMDVFELSYWNNDMFYTMRLCSIYDSTPAWQKVPLIPALNQSRSLLSGHSILFTKECLQRCTSQHSDCMQEPQAALPSRLLEVGSENQNTIRLIKVQDLVSEDPVQIRYAALSYCWGGDHHVKLTKNSILPMQSEIEVTGLPETIYNAVQVTRSLDIRYLWLDALCILQDDNDDWDYESSRIGLIYTNAYVTLKATMAKASTSGFLKLELSADSFEFSFPWINEQGDQASLVLRPSLREKDDSGPLGKRAWALQEELLSTRVLSFTSEEIMWRCRSQHTCQCRCRDPEYLKIAISDLATREDATNFWRNTVEKYTRRELTYRRDKLPAIAAVAERIAPMVDSKYIAGIWEGGCIRDLLWSVVGERHPASREFISPTFSWASVFSQVEYFLSKDYEIDCRMEASYVTLDGRSKFGRVTDETSIQLRGRLFLAKHAQIWDCSKYSKQAINSGVTIKYNGYNFQFKPDTILEESGLLDVNGVITESYLKRSIEGSGGKISDFSNVCLYLFSIGKAREFPELQVFLVLSRSCRKSNAFERLGIAEIRWEQWLEWAKKSQSENTVIEIV
ncbi:heterokaryon incompatibility protein-domain-containing protein [Nemania sp. FL0916]|nr:heterokaryon incompatibility protein-domain-containing protein [Nemania sp. FL0916]